ncbi:PorT family protein [Microbacter margulisiae]|uniref:Outer membrane protein beta-barrel domain-containing protein n=1 Tax=Microbacter margulisiae TaxID=1350067 RepID=A0A7W5DQS9_9PORP|nr:PorT family protein [Microbacter margulisiae]MBB3187301.1 hypothetical protein [Microbacter margulisiae]
MKKIIFLSFLILVIGSSVFASNLAPADTTILFNHKLIKVEEENDQIKVNVYNATTLSDTVPEKKLYEGIYSNGKSYEKWTVMEELGIQLPSFLNGGGKKHKHFGSAMKPHWAGFGIGFSNLTDGSFHMTNVDGITLKADQSTEWFINLFQHIIPLYNNNLGLTTGLGMSWYTFRLDDNTHLVDVNGVTQVAPAPAGINYQYSRLKVTYLTIPALLEWQPFEGRAHAIYLSAGVVAGIKTFSSYKVCYNDASGHTVNNVEARGLNTNPISINYMGQIGIGSISVYAKYSPTNLFQSGKGPSVRPVSLGLILHF